MDKLECNVDGKMINVNEMNQNQLNRALTEVLEIIGQTCYTVTVLEENDDTDTLNEFRAKLISLEQIESVLIGNRAKILFDSKKEFKFNTLIIS